MTARQTFPLALVLTCCSSYGAAQTGELAYVQASRIALRAGSSPTATVIGYLTTNAEVRIESRQGEWCAVAVPADTRRGFLACRFIGEARLTEDVIRARLEDLRLSPAEQLDWTARAFWVSPSLLRWTQVGKLMEQALLTSADRTREKAEGKLLRPPNAEFQAMKQRLAAGVTVAIRPPESKTYGNWPDEQEPLRIARTRAELPPVRLSHFSAQDPPYAVPLAPFGLGDALYAAVGMVDALSLTHAAPFRRRVLSPARFEGGSDDSITGVWDAGTIGVTFDKEVLIHGVTPRSRAVAVRVESLTIRTGDDWCSRSPLGFRTRVIKGNGLASARLAWVGKSPIEGKTAVKIRRVDGAESTSKLIIEDIDLDGDGVADFSVWAGRFRFVIADDGTEGYWKAVFANVGGAWRLVGYDQTDECT